MHAVGSGLRPVVSQYDDRIDDRDDGRGHYYPAEYVWCLKGDQDEDEES